MRMRHTPVSASPARIARSTGAAPRQRGSSEKCTFTNPSGSASRNGGREQLTERDDDAELGARSRRRRRSTSRARAGRAHRQPELGAASFTGLGSWPPPRPRRRSGWVTTRATSWPASTRARSGSDGVGRRAEEDEAHASAQRPRSETPDPRVAAGRSRGRARGRSSRSAALALVGLEPVEQQHAVEVVDLVLEHAAEQLVALDHDLVAVEVDAAAR